MSRRQRQAIKLAWQALRDKAIPAAALYHGITVDEAWEAYHEGRLQFFADEAGNIEATLQADLFAPPAKGAAQ